jgi:galactarate dehydratase
MQVCGFSAVLEGLEDKPAGSFETHVLTTPQLSTLNSTMRPLCIQVHPQDNVAIVVNDHGLAAGSRFGNGLVLTESVPQAHKVTLRDLEKGNPVVRYGQTIGTLNRALRAGAWVQEEVLDLPLAPALDMLPLATAIPAPMPALEGFTFEGYPNPDGTVGTKNIHGITTTVQCVAPTVDHAVRRIEAEILPRFPGVDGVVAVTHGYGCGVAI